MKIILLYVCMCILKNMLENYKNIFNMIFLERKGRTNVVKKGGREMWYQE